MKNLQIIRNWGDPFTSLGLGTLLLWLSLFLIHSIAIAAPPESTAIPVEFNSQTTLTITSTKISDPHVEVKAGEVLTYTIVFTSDTDTESVVVTDSIPASTTYIKGTITGTPAVSITGVSILNNTLVWTVSNITLHNPVTLTFAVTVARTTKAGTLITNTAWFSDITGVYSAMTTVTANQPSLPDTYLPLVLKNYRCSQDAYEPNDGGDPLTTANTRQWDFGSGSSIVGNFCLDYPDPSDYFWLSLDSGTLEIWLYPPSTGDYDVYIYKNNALQTPYGNNSGLGVPEHIVYNVTGPATYFIRVYPYNKGQGDTYSLKVVHP